MWVIRVRSCVKRLMIWVVSTSVIWCMWQDHSPGISSCSRMRCTHAGCWWMWQRCYHGRATDASHELLQSQSELSAWMMCLTVGSLTTCCCISNCGCGSNMIMNDVPMASGFPECSIVKGVCVNHVHMRARTRIICEQVIWCRGKFESEIAWSRACVRQSMRLKFCKDDTNSNLRM